MTRALEAIVAGKTALMAVVDELLAPNYLVHGGAPSVTPDREGFKKLFAGFYMMYSDIYMTIEDMIAEGDKVVVRETWGGTPNVPVFEKMRGITPTVNKINVKQVDIFRILDGQIVEHRIFRDNLDYFKQIGMKPPS